MAKERERRVKVELIIRKDKAIDAGRTVERIDQLIQKAMSCAPEIMNAGEIFADHVFFEPGSPIAFAANYFSKETWAQRAQATFAN